MLWKIRIFKIDNHSAHFIVYKQITEINMVKSVNFISDSKIFFPETHILDS